MQYYLKHHGIKGQQWGKKNGPPYPLDAEDHSIAEKKAEKKAKKGLIKKVKDKYVYLKNKHYSRNEMQKDAPQSPQEAIEQGWIKLSDKMSALHQNFLVDGKKNLKFVSPDGHGEIVFTSDGKRTTHVEDEGTYNFGSPTTNKLKHVALDVIPYYVWGNSIDDVTTISERAKQTVINCFNIPMKKVVA